MLIKNQPIRTAFVWIILSTSFAFAALGQQKVAYTNDETILNGMAQRVRDMLAERTVTGVATAQRNILNTLTFDGIAAKLPTKRTKRLTSDEVYEKCKASSLYYGKYAYDATKKAYEASFLASAIVLSEDGICATNFHVLNEIILPGAVGLSYSKSDSLRFIGTIDGKIYPLKEVLAYDAASDLAIFRVDVGKDKLTPIPIGDDAPVGMDAYAITHPKKYFYYFTQGVVARNKIGERAGGGPKVEWMDITTDYSVGSSGGPIIDRFGNLIGMVSFTRTLYNDDRLKDFPQMVVKTTVPVIRIKNLFKK